MKKSSKIRIIVAVILLGVFCFVNAFFPFDEYYMDLERCENSDKNIFANAELVVKHEVDDLIYETWTNNQGELYVIQIRTKDTFGVKRYKIAQSYSYSVENEIKHYALNKEPKWKNCPEINIHKEPVFSWCLLPYDEELLKSVQDDYVYLNYDNEKCVLIYHIS